MTTKTLKERKCKLCKHPFIPIVFLQPTCFECAGYWIKLINEKKWKKKKKEMKDKLKTHSDYLQELQPIFNKYIVLRDKSLPCISCGATSGVRFSAGHYFTVGAHPNLRFNELNTHKQCWYNCNKNKRGNLTNYRPALIKKIGEAKFNELEVSRNIPLKLSIPEIQELKKVYREKIKLMK